MESLRNGESRAKARKFNISKMLEKCQTPCCEWASFFFLKAGFECVLIGVQGKTIEHVIEVLVNKHSLTYAYKRPGKLRMKMTTKLMCLISCENMDYEIVYSRLEPIPEKFNQLELYA